MLKWLQLHVSLRRCAELERRLAVGIGNDGISQLYVLLFETPPRLAEIFDDERHLADGAFNTENCHLILGVTVRKMMIPAKLYSLSLLPKWLWQESHHHSTFI